MQFGVAPFFSWRRWFLGRVSRGRYNMNNNPAQHSPEQPSPEQPSSTQQGTEHSPAQPSAADHSNLEGIAESAVSPLGFEVLEVQQQRQGGEQIVLIRIDRLDEQPVTMEDLLKASRAAEAEFDRLDPIPGEYRLEFESPGAKRPLRRARHFERMLGLKAKVKAAGQSFTAQIKSVQGDEVTFAVADDDVTLKAGDIQANLAEFPDKHR